NSPSSTAGRSLAQRNALQHKVARALHAQAQIGLLRDMVLFFDIETQSDHGRIGDGRRMDMLIESTENTLAARVSADIDALDPPDPAIAPVAPLARQHQLADHLAV